MRARPSSLLLAVLAASAPAAALTGRDVIEQAQQQHGFSTWRDRTQSALMQTYDGDALARERTFDVVEQTDPRGDHKTFLHFTGPTDVQGATFLHLSPRGERDQQWLWTPASRKARRLAEAQQDENFFGSDLSYRDLELIVRIQQWTDADSTATLLRREAGAGKPSHLVELVPANDEFPYSRYRLWFDTSDLLLWQVEVYDAKDREKLLKRVTLRDYERVDGFATAREADVRNVPADTHTRMLIRDVRYNRGVAEDTFTLGNLSRGQ